MSALLLPCWAKYGPKFVRVTAWYQHANGGDLYLGTYAGEGYPLLFREDQLVPLTRLSDKEGTG